MEAFLVQIAQRLARAMHIANADFLSPDDLLLEIQAAPHGEDEFLLLYNFINSFQAVQSFSNGTGTADKYDAAKKAHQRNLTALKTKIEALEAANGAG